MIRNFSSSVQLDIFSLARCADSCDINLNTRRAHKQPCVTLFINILKTIFLTIFARFPNIFRRFRKILQKLSEDQTNVSEHFPKISQDCGRFPKITEDFRGRSDDVSIIQQHIYVPLRDYETIAIMIYSRVTVMGSVLVDRFKRADTTDKTIHHS